MLGQGALALASCLPLAQGDSPTQGAIDAAVERGLGHLLELYADGEGRDALAGARQLTLLDHPGLRALVLYTLLQCGVDPAHRTPRNLLERLAYERFESTYGAACMLLALSAYDPAGEHAWIDELTADLLAWREEAGDWGYPGGGDLSNTQFAALALRAADLAGVDVPSAVWSDLARAVLRYQTRDGGFAYVAGGRRATGSMTAAGVSTLSVCTGELERDGLLDTELAREVGSARAEGIAWLADHFSVEHNPQHAAWQYYYLYGLERVGALAAVTRIGEHDWYGAGARELVRNQGGDGAWAGTFERVPTLFALLFLRRATAPRGPETGVRRPAPVAVAAPPRRALVVDGPNRMADARAKARASSAASSDPARDFGARHVVDGNARTPWIAAPGDAEPRVTIQLRRKQRVDRVRVTLARLIPDGPFALGRPSSLSLRLRPGDELCVPIAEGAERVELELERPVLLRSIELRLTGGSGADAPLGIGEVELFLSAE